MAAAAEPCCCDEDDGTTPDGEATAAAATTTQLEKEMGLGMEMPPPGGKNHPPGDGVTGTTRVADRIENPRALILCHEYMRKMDYSVVSIEICPKGYIYKRRPQTLD